MVYLLFSVDATQLEQEEPWVAVVFRGLPDDYKKEDVKEMLLDPKLASIGLREISAVKKIRKTSKQLCIITD